MDKPQISFHRGITVHQEQNENHDNIKRKLNKQSLFERLIIAAALLALVQGIYQLPKLIETYGYWEGVFDAFAMPIISMLIGLAVSRLRSRVAAVIFVVSLILTLGVLGFDLFDMQWKNLPYALGASSVALEAVAAWIAIGWMFAGNLGPQNS